MSSASHGAHLLVRKRSYVEEFHKMSSNISTYAMLCGEVAFAGFGPGDELQQSAYGYARSRILCARTMASLERGISTAMENNAL